MKTFKDLKFEEHPLDGEMAKMEFENNYGVSVIFGGMFYSNGIDTYELAVLYDGQLSYSTDITDDVLGYISESEVTEAMIKVQNLKN